MLPLWESPGSFDNLTVFTDGPRKDIPSKNLKYSWWFQTFVYIFYPGAANDMIWPIFFQMGWFNHQFELKSLHDPGVGSLYCIFHYLPGYFTTIQTVVGLGFIPSPTVSQVIQGLPVDEQNLIFAGRSLESTERRGSSNRSISHNCGLCVWKDVFSMMSYIFASVCVCVIFGDSIDKDKWWGIMIHYVLYWDTYEAFQ